MIVGLFKGKTIGESIPSIGGGTPSGVFFVGVILAVALIPFFAFREVGRAIGERALHSLMFTGGPKAAAFRSEWAKGAPNLHSHCLTEGDEHAEQKTRIFSEA